jgi:hypothetical protein
MPHLLGGMRQLFGDVQFCRKKILVLVKRTKPMKLRKNFCFGLLAGTALAVLTSFVQPTDADTGDCRFTYLWSSDFRNKTMEISNVFRVAPGYTPPDPRSRYRLYSDSAEAAIARQNSVRHARASEYQLMLSNYNNQCTK